jgi:hypothetical protein
VLAQSGNHAGLMPLYSVTSIYVGWLNIERPKTPNIQPSECRAAAPISGWAQLLALKADVADV